VAGIALAAGICVAGGVALQLVSRSLPQAEQEALETVVGGIAVAAVTFMIVWMRRNARGLRRPLENDASRALAEGSVIALVGMAFFAVIREGFETSVFLLAAFDSSTSPAATGAGAVLGVVVAIAIGWAIYRGGRQLNLARFFRLTGLVLVLVAGAWLRPRSTRRTRPGGWTGGRRRRSTCAGLWRPAASARRS
jgi:high-affinity iron transporter